MAPRYRRNVISRRDAVIVVVIACAAALVAMAAGCQPTGNAVGDVVITGAFAGFVTWSAASAPWWGLVTMSGVAAMSATQPLWLAASLVALGGSSWIGVWKSSLAPLRAVVAAVSMQALLRVDGDPFFLAPTLISGSVAGLVVVSGISRRPRDVRQRLLVGGYVAAGALALAIAGTTVAWFQAQPNVSDGYEALIDGMGALRQADPSAAAIDLRAAADDLRNAADALSSPWSQPGRLVPVVAQHHSAMVDVGRRAADAAEAAADTLDLVDLDALRMRGGVIDVEALALLQGPARELERAVDELSLVLDQADSPWLVSAFRSRLERAQADATDLAVQAEITRQAADAAPAMLGNDGPRRYFVAFTSPAEVRGQSGLMGNWAELTFERGRLRLTADGRTAELQRAIVESDGITIDMPDEYYSRYRRYGAGDGESGVDRTLWVNATMSPHNPTVGSVMAQLYEASTGRAVDGVIIVDPAGVAALLDITGPVRLADERITLTSANAEQFLLIEQYERATSDREDLLEAATRGVIDRLLSIDLPGPQVMADAMGEAVAGGHVTFFATRPDEQLLFELIGMDAHLPLLPLPSGTDALAVVNDNASANKIDTFLERQSRYRAQFDPSSGVVDAELTVTITNQAPTAGYPDYVLNNLVGLPAGTNRTILSVFSALDLVAASLDGEPITMVTDRERGWNVHSAVVTIPPGGTVEVDLQLTGTVGGGEYRLFYRPQPLARPERLDVEVTGGRRSLLAGFVGTLRERTVIDRSGLTPWRG